MARAWPGQSQEPGDPCGCHMDDRGSGTWAALPGTLLGSWMGSRAVGGLQPALQCGMPALRGSLTCCAVMLILIKISLIAVFVGTVTVSDCNLIFDFIWF